MLAVAVAVAATLACARTARATSCAARTVSRAAAMVCDINRVRAEHGLHPLRVDDRLADAAHDQAEDMVRRDFFSHVTPGGATLTDRLRRSGYLRTQRHWSIGEALGWGTGATATPAAMVAAWLHSPPHRAILLAARFADVGVGVARGVPVSNVSGATYVADFGFRR